MSLTVFVFCYTIFSGPQGVWCFWPIGILHGNLLLGCPRMREDRRQGQWRKLAEDCWNETDQGKEVWTHPLSVTPSGQQMKTGSWSLFKSPPLGRGQRSPKVSGCTIDDVGRCGDLGVWKVWRDHGCTFQEWSHCNGLAEWRDHRTVKPVITKTQLTSESLSLDHIKKYIYIFIKLYFNWSTFYWNTSLHVLIMWQVQLNVKYQLKKATKNINLHII